MVILDVCKAGPGVRVCVAGGGVPHCNRQRLSATKQLVTNPLNQLDPRALPKKEMSLNSLMQTKSPIRSNDDVLPGGTPFPAARRTVAH